MGSVPICYFIGTTRRVFRRIRTWMECVSQRNQRLVIIIVLEKVTTTYVCEKCRKSFDSRMAAARCESVPITQDRGVKVGDIVRITYGQGAGARGLVERISVLDSEYAPVKGYTHTIALSVKCIDSYGNRFLLHDHYCVLSAAE